MLKTIKSHPSLIQLTGVSNRVAARPQSAPPQLFFKAVSQTHSGRSTPTEAVEAAPQATQASAKSIARPQPRTSPLRARPDQPKKSAAEIELSHTTALKKLSAEFRETDEYKNAPTDDKPKCFTLSFVRMVARRSRFGVPLTRTGLGKSGICELKRSKEASAKAAMP